jgi:hypothetical protein
MYSRKLQKDLLIKKIVKSKLKKSQITTKRLLRCTYHIIPQNDQQNDHSIQQDDHLIPQKHNFLMTFDDQMITYYDSCLTF